MAIATMERHPLGSQAFVALSPMPFLVVVAAANTQPGPLDIRCYLAAAAAAAAAGQGVNHGRGTLHRALIALDQPGDFLVIDRGGPADQGNCDEITLANGSEWLARWRHPYGPAAIFAGSGMPTWPPATTSECGCG